MRARVLFPHGRVHPSNGPLCVLLCCSHMVVFIFQVGPVMRAVLLWCSHMVVYVFEVARMVVFIFQVARYPCYCAVPTWSCSLFKRHLLAVGKPKMFQVARYVC